jgi:hypothetical protein
MSALPVAAFLPDLGLERGVNGARILPRAERDDGPFVGLSEAQWQSKVEQAYAAGLEHGTAAGRAALEARVDELRREFQARLAAEREAWASAEGTQLAAQLSAGLDALEDGIAQEVARVLGPFLGAEVRRQAVSELRTTIATLLAGKTGVALSIAGPPDLLEALTRGLEGSGCVLTCTPSPTCEVRIAADQTVIETRLSDWAKKIEEAIR